MIKVIGVRFRTAGKIYFFDPVNFEIEKYGLLHGDCIEVQISYCPFCGKKL